MKMAKMKFVQIVIVLLLLFGNIQSQNRFFPDVSKQPVWYVYSMNLYVCAAEDCYNYKQVVRYSIEPTANQPANGDSTYTLFGEVISANYDFIDDQKRELGTITLSTAGKVYYVWPDTVTSGFVDSRGVLMYDDALQVGDSVDPGYWLKFDTIVVYRYPAIAVNTIDNISLAGTSRERWKLGPNYAEDGYFEHWYNNLIDVPIDSTLQFIEGVGSNQGILYSNQSERLSQLVCYEELGDTIYRLIPGSPCDIALRDISSTGVTDGANNVKIFPNPTTGSINIVLLQGVWSYTIVNVLGQKVAEGSVSPQRYQVDFDLANGTYIIELKEDFGTGHINKRFVVQN